MIDSIDTILQSRCHEGKPHVHINKPDGEHGGHKDKTRDVHDLNRAPRELLKELDCLYGVSHLVDCHGNCLDEVLQGIIDLIPRAWRYPEVCGARIRVHDTGYQTVNFRETNWHQSSEVHVGGELAGSVEACYLEKMPELDEGPFSREERSLIDAIAERVGKIAERLQITRQLEVEHMALESANSVLRQVLSRIEEEKSDIRREIADNVEKILMPSLRELKTQVPAHYRPYVSQTMRELENITSPFVNRLSTAFAALTPAEIKVCKMIKNGLSTNEIAHLRHVSPSTVTKQREQIRRKLGIQGTETNLASYLLTFGMKEGAAAVQ